MLEAFLNTKTKQVILTDTNSIFWPLKVSQVNVNTMEKVSEQWPELQVAKYLIVHVPFSSFNVYSFEFWKERKTTQQWGLRVVNGIELIQVRVYRERVYADNVVSIFWFVRSFSSQHHSKFLANFATERLTQVRTKKRKTRFFIFKVSLTFLRSSRHLNCNTSLTVIVSFLNESVHASAKTVMEG